MSTPNENILFRGIKKKATLKLRQFILKTKIFIFLTLRQVSKGANYQRHLTPVNSAVAARLGAASSSLFLTHSQQISSAVDMKRQAVTLTAAKCLC